MSIFPINPLSGRSTSRLPIIQKVINHRCNRRIKRLEKISQDIDNAMMSLRQHPNYMQTNDYFIRMEKRQESVKKYLKDREFAPPDIEHYDIIGRAQVGTTPKFLILKDRVQLYGDDLDQIYKDLGAYGLAQYADIMPICLDIPSIQEKHTGTRGHELSTIDGDVKENLQRYLWHNNKGFAGDIYLRFGQYGRDEFENAKICGCVASTIYVDDPGRIHSTYHLTNKGATFYFPYNLFM